MDMDLTKLGFLMMPAWFCLIGVVFSLIFGSDLLRIYREKLAIQRREIARSKIDWPVFVKKHAGRRPRKSERELVSTH